MKQPGWYINRLKTMSLTEMVFRLFQAIRYFFEKKTRVGFFPVIDVIPETRRLFNNIEGHIKNKYPDEIDIFGISFNYLIPTLWHKDLYSANSFPEKYSREIDMRTPKYGSAKHVWEINRMHFLTWLCMNYKFTGDEYYLTIFKEKIVSWIKQNPYLIGINWYSNIEINIRLINWIVCWEILEAEKLAEVNKEFRIFLINHWLPLIYLHCLYSSANPSYFSSANNHLVSEYAGLFLAALKWQFPQSERWLKKSKRGLEREIRKQHSENGINKEEAAEYIQFITDFFLLSYVGGCNAGVCFSDEYKDMLRKIMSFINHFLDCRFNYPHYGDDDDGFVLRLDSRQTADSNFKSLLISAALLFNESGFLSGINEFDIKNALLFGEEGKRQFFSLLKHSSPTRKKDEMLLYKKEGHFIIKKIVNQKEIYCHFDAAPLGFLSIAAHGHADALSFILTIEGQPFLVDSGTYTYHADPLFRKYFVGTLAHNTVRINQLDQAFHAGPTMWNHHFTITSLSLADDENEIAISASHNGYRKTGAVHSRTFRFNKSASEFHIADHITNKKRQPLRIEMPFHLHPDIQCKPYHNNKGFILVYGESQIVLLPDSRFSWRIVKGSKSPVLGWYSHAFHQLTPANVIIGDCVISEDAIFNTQIAIKQI